MSARILAGETHPDLTCPICGGQIYLMRCLEAEPGDLPTATTPKGEPVQITMKCIGARFEHNCIPAVKR